MGSVGVILWISMAAVVFWCAAASEIYSLRLIHRFSGEMEAFSGARAGDSWPERGSLEYYRKLLVRDFRRQKMKLTPRHQLLFPYEGSQSTSFGNELGWLHYTWIDIGTPKTPFLVALDDGSDILWLPCNCIQCAPLSASYYNTLDRDLNEYFPSGSNTSRNLPCSHELCDSDSNCKTSMQPCQYTVEYSSDNTSSSGMLFEDVLLLSSSSTRASNASLEASIILGCGRKQSGGYLEGAAPDGLMGLGFGRKSVPSLLAKAGLVRNSFSLCFNDDGSGAIFFGDQGHATQKMTPFLPQDGTYETYIVGVDSCCIGKDSCLKETSFNALIDSGTSFTSLPTGVYDKVVQEFDSQVKAKKITFDGYPWEYCYSGSGQEQSDFPSIRFMFDPNNSFVVHSPMLEVYGTQGETLGYCLTLQEGANPIIGQDFMTGYRIVFDRENLKLGWSRSNCSDISNDEIPSSGSPTNGGPPNSLPTDEQQSAPRGRAVAPAIAGKAPLRSSAEPGALLSTSTWLIFSRLIYLSTMLLVC